MTGLEDTDGNNDTPNMQSLGNAMSKAVKEFAQCSLLENENSFVTQKIREIKEQSVKFQEYANESIDQSDKLSKYAEEVVVFAVACADPSFTKEELIDFLKLTLEEAKKNKAKTEELKANISDIMTKLVNVQNESVQYSNDIQVNARAMNSSVVNELENREFEQKLLRTAYKVGAGAAILGTTASIIAAPLTGGASLAIPLIESIVEGGLIMAGATGVIAIGSKYAYNNRNNEINALNRQLIIERDELITQICSLNGNLSSIIHESCDILNFWDEQITSLNDLIVKLERFDGNNGERPSRLVTLTIQKKWNNVSRECKDYNRTMRAALQVSNMVTSE
ncbi:hypothetical protein RclHR1_11320005 [Rhizophagus clarus]|uniref:Uncharacterized protein n=1 Tax=Rhizophagus clarus TaxID=94130 RepID=A0A2Z6Q5H2_9GLOM|nr:hypothetical protein RclHR1_11320005 [Rhizophagus clarus]GES76901.1 hypothetical protein GLOIN_2v1773019 [Rhizophagus clarus]